MSEPRAQVYEVDSYYENPKVWPEDGTKFCNLIEYLRASTECAGITIHSDKEGREHATYYCKYDSVGGGVLHHIRENGYTVTRAGHGSLPPETSPTSWVSDESLGEAGPYVEFKPTEYVQSIE